ncbi:MAG: IPT/TIG domain-containing protein [Deltaproteobacteria bacterium]|nr:IPT/TIG domain-containing protein [Deltaproteobacteria bacterium]
MKLTAEDLATLMSMLHRHGVGVEVGDAARIARAFAHAETWDTARKLRILKMLVARTPEERQRVDDLGSLLLPPYARERSTWTTSRDGTNVVTSWPARLLLVVAVASLLAAAVIAYFTTKSIVILPPRDADVDVAAVDVSSDSNDGAPQQFARVDGTVVTPSALPVLLGRAAAGTGMATLLVFGVLLIWRRRSVLTNVAVPRLAQSVGRRVLVLPIPAAEDVHPIAHSTIRAHADSVGTPSAVEDAWILDARETVEQTTRNAGRITLCFVQPVSYRPIVLIEDLGRSMERWPAHAEQLARALSAQGHHVVRRFMSTDPGAITVERTFDVPRLRLEEIREEQRGEILIVSDAQHFDPPATRTPAMSESLAETTWFHPGPEELWGPGARWVASVATMKALGAQPHRGTNFAKLPARWFAPRPMVDPEEVIAGWRRAMGNNAFDAFATTALLDASRSWTTLAVYALVSEGVIAPPWRELERAWELPGVQLLPGGRIRVEPALLERLLAEARRRDPEQVARVAKWIKERLEVAIADADVDSMAASVGALYLDRTELGAGIDTSGRRAKKLARSGLAGLVAANVSETERARWRIGPPAWERTLRVAFPVLLLVTGGLTAGHYLAPDTYPETVSSLVPIDGGVAPHQVKDISPASGPAKGGTRVTITGTGLAGARSVEFTPSGPEQQPPRPAAITSNTESQLTIETPDGDPGQTMDVVLKFADGPIDLNGAFSYDPDPLPAAFDVSALSPTKGRAGTLVTIRGTFPDEKSIKVVFGSRTATGDATPTEIKVTAPPPKAAGPVNVDVMLAPKPVRAKQRFTYLADHEITTVLPSTGPSGGGTLLTIGGKGLLGAKLVEVGTRKAPITANTDSQIQVLTPPGTAKEIADVVVTFADGETAVKKAPFLYDDSNGTPLAPGAARIVSFTVDPVATCPGTSVKATWIYQGTKGELISSSTGQSTPTGIGPAGVQSVLVTGTETITLRVTGADGSSASRGVPVTATNHFTVIGTTQACKDNVVSYVSSTDFLPSLTIASVHFTSEDGDGMTYKVTHNGDTVEVGPQGAVMKGPANGPWSFQGTLPAGITCKDLDKLKPPMLQVALDCPHSASN